MATTAVEKYGVVAAAMATGDHDDRLMNAATADGMLLCRKGQGFAHIDWAADPDL